MKNARAINILSAIFNALVLGGVIYATVAFLLKDFVGSLIFFTVLSNLLVGVAALICLPFNFVGIAKKKLLPKGIYVFKLIATTSVAVTFVVATALLPILSGSTIPAQYGDFSFQKVEFFMHLIVPVAAMVGFIFFDHTQKAKFPVTILAIIPVVLYGIFYILNYFLHFKSVNDNYDWYGFVSEPGKEGMAFALFAGVLVGAFVLAVVLFLLNRLLNKAFFKQAAVQPAPAKEEPVSAPVEEQPEQEPVEEEKEEPAPAEEYYEPEEKELESEPEESEEEPAKEEAPVERKPAAASVRRAVPAQKEEPAKKAEPVKRATPAKKEEQPAPAARRAQPAKKGDEPAKAEPAKKVAPAKKEEAQPEPVKKPAPAKKQEPEKKEEPAKKEVAAPAKDSGPTKVYHLTKRKEDGMWAITFVGGQKAVKLFKTKKEAEAALKVLTENQGATALIRNSKGAKAGKFASSIKTDDNKK